MIGGAALGGERGLCVSVADVLIAGGVYAERFDLVARAADRRGTGLLVDRGHFGASAVDPARLAVVVGELDVITDLEFERLRRVALHLASAPLAQTPVNLPAILGFEHDSGFDWINALHTVRLAPRYTFIGIITAELNNVAFVVTLRYARLGARQAFGDKTLHVGGWAGERAGLSKCRAYVSGEGIAALARWLDDQRFGAGGFVECGAGGQEFVAFEANSWKLAKVPRNVDIIVMQYSGLSCRLSASALPCANDIQSHTHQWLRYAI